MSNLLPLHARKQILYEYWVRVISVWLMLLTAALGVVAILKAPTYFLIDTQLGVIGEEYANAQKTEAAHSAVSETLNQANGLADFLKGQADTRTFTEFLTEVDRVTANGVQLDSVTISRDAGEITNVQIVGVARTRDSLAQLRETILASEYFTEANIPISNFAKERDINFSITIEPAPASP